MSALLFKNVQIVRDGSIVKSDLLVDHDRIARIDRDISHRTARIIDAEGKYLIPGIIDDQVHFREPGLIHKADIASESAAAAAGGITSYMEMPNTQPQTLTQELLEDKYQRAAQVSLVNYSFYMGASNDNLSEVLKTDPATVCGVKVFMGSSTGDMLVDDEQTLRGIFREVPLLIATHCESEQIIQENLAAYRARYKDQIPFFEHPNIRSRQACLASSSMAVELAREYGTRLHVLHISTADELRLFSDQPWTAGKKITCEACVHHLWFSDQDYESKGSLIKWNPAIKSSTDRQAIRQAVREGRIDVVATDHAPHTITEKQADYLHAPSGGPLVQHALPAMLEMVREGVFSLEQIVERMCHMPAKVFQIAERGFIEEGFKADLVLLDLQAEWTVSKQNILYKCGWSPFEQQTFHSEVVMTLVNGQIVYEHGVFNPGVRGERLQFCREKL